jgi:hypothetical protein
MVPSKFDAYQPGVHRVHPAGEPILLGRRCRQVHRGLGEGDQVGGDAAAASSKVTVITGARASTTRSARSPGGDVDALAPPGKAAVLPDGDFLQRPAAEATWVTTSGAPGVVLDHLLQAGDPALDLA